MSEQSRTNAFATDAPWRFVSCSILAANLFWSALLFAGMIHGGGTTQRIFEGFDTRPPLIYQIASSIPFQSILPVLALLALAKEWSIQNVKLKIWTNLIHTFVIQAIQAIFVVGLFQSLFELLNRPS